MPRSRTSDDHILKAQYYVQYLGWKECRGLGGREHTEPIVKDLVVRRKVEKLPKLTIEVSKTELKIQQTVEKKKKKKGGTENINYPTIPSKDVTYATASLSPDEDVVACIYLGYNQATRCTVHVHVYRFDSQSTAEVFVSHLNQIISRAEHQHRLEEIEQELVAQGQISPRPKGLLAQYVDTRSTDSDRARTVDALQLPDEDLFSRRDQIYERSGESDQNMSSNRRYMALGQWLEADDTGISGRRSYSSEEQVEYHPETEKNMQHLNAELRDKLGLQTSPILLPPKDYDTVSRKHGNLIGIEARRSQNDAITKGQAQTNSGRSSSGGFSEGSGHGNKQLVGHSDEDDILAVSPRWKLGHGQYVPPVASRADEQPYADHYGMKKSPQTYKDRHPYDRRLEDPRNIPEARSSTDGHFRQNPEMSRHPDYAQGYRHSGDQYELYPNSAGLNHEKKYTAQSLGLVENSPHYPKNGERWEPTGHVKNLAGSPKNVKSKDRKQKKDMKKRDSGNPGDELPVDYTIGPAKARNTSYQR